MPMSEQALSSGRLDLSSVPPIYILPTHIITEDLHQYEDQVYAAGGALTYSATEARIFLGKISQKKRASFELRSNGVWTEEAPAPMAPKHKTSSQSEKQPERKRRKLDEDFRGTSSTESSSEHLSDGNQSPSGLNVTWPDLTFHVLVLKLDWLDLCLRNNTLLPYAPHLVYAGKVIPRPSREKSPSSKSSTVVTYIKANPDASHASSSRQPPTPSSSTVSHTPRRFHSSAMSRSPTLTKHPPPKLHRTTTSEHERPSSGTVSPSRLPPLPSWATGPYSSYSCCRSTPLHTTNAAFIAQLSAIKLSRILIVDEIGVRAYSTAIASLSAYPHAISSEAEVLRLPGCNNRIAELWWEWYDSAATESERYIQNVRDIDASEDLKVVELFYDIWGVGADTARKFAFTHHFKDLDDLVEYHWHGLTRVQQIGVKYYDEFKVNIPRKEVEQISDVILQHARRVCDIPESDFNGPNDAVCVIFGGYRRGKAESGDVDVILSHRKESYTKNLVVDVVRSLEGEGRVTHTLTLQTTTSDRDQQTLPYKGKGHGHGFDSLDKALCVWQDPNFNEAEAKGGKNPNIHRRVDIILSPWRTVGCAVLGWSGGTTFQRDIRRFASHQKGWKFDSSGIRDRGSGMVVDLERPREGDEGDTWEDRERRVMEGLGIGYRAAPERCTG